MISRSYELLDSQDRPVGDLDGVTGGSAEIVAQDVLGGSGSLTLDHRQEIDWMSNRLRVICHASAVKSWPVGTYLFASPKENHTSPALGYEVGLNRPRFSAAPMRGSALC